MANQRCSNSCRDMEHHQRAVGYPQILERSRGLRGRLNRPLAPMVGLLKLEPLLKLRRCCFLEASDLLNQTRIRCDLLLTASSPLKPRVYTWDVVPQTTMRRAGERSTRAQI